MGGMWDVANESASSNKQTISLSFDSSLVDALQSCDSTRCGFADSSPVLDRSEPRSLLFWTRPSLHTLSSRRLFRPPPLPSHHSIPPLPPALSVDSCIALGWTS